MNDLYWLTVLGNVKNVANGFIFVSAIVFSISIVGYIINRDDDNNLRVCLNFLRPSIVVLVITILISCFTPTTKELYFIYGVGSTIDYLKSNPTAKQLPDKYIDLLDAWTDKMIEDTKKGKNE